MRARALPPRVPAYISLLVVTRVPFRGGVAVFLAVGLSACALRPSPITDATRPFRLHGFTVTPPLGPGWYVTRQNPAEVQFSKKTAHGGALTVLAFAGSFAPGAPVTSQDDLSRFSGDMMRQDLQNPRLRIIEFRSEPTPTATALCERHTFVAEDRGVPYASGKVFVLSGRQLVCVHPESKGTFLVLLGTSERRLQTLAAVPYEPEVQPFFDSLEFRPLP